MSSLKEWFIPQDKAFYDLMEKIAKNVLVGADRLYDLFDNFSDAEGIAVATAGIKAVEHEGDDLTHQIFTRMNKVFITPIDREDLSALATAFDDVLDYIEAVASRVSLYEIKKPTKHMMEFSKLIVEAVTQLVAAVELIKSPKRFDEVDQYCSRIHQLENVADDLLNGAIAQLFKEADVIDIIKLKEIYENLEIVTDKCEDVATILRDMIIKYA